MNALSLKQVQQNAQQAQQKLWNIVWRAAFMVLGDEDKAERIANEATNPSAVKDDVVVPDTVSAPNQETWVCVYKAALNNCGDEQQAKTIADAVSSKSDSEIVNDEVQKSVTDTNSKKTVKNSKKSMAVSSVNQGSLVIQKNGGSVRVSSAIKSADNYSPEEGWVEGYLVSWGSTKDTDLQGEFFSARTEFCLDWFGERPVLYHHGMDDSTGLKKIGVFKSVRVDDIGLWVQAQLDLRDRYARAVYDMVAAKQFGWSSGSVDHLVKIGENGEILVWPLIEGSITPTPAQPAKTAVRPIKSTDVLNNRIMTMQAFKAVLSGDAESSEYLRGLEEHLNSLSDIEIPKARVATQKTIATRTKNTNGFIEGDSMTRNTESAWYITRAVAKAFGIKDATAEELDAVASEVQDVVNSEVSAAAAQALEDEATIASDQDLVASSTASYNRNRQNRGQSYRQVVPPGESTAQDDTVPVSGAATMQDDVPAAAASYRRATRQAQVDPAASNIETAMMQEIAAQMEEDNMEQQAARALRRKAWNRAMRQIADTPDAMTQYQEPATLQDPATLSDDEATVASYNRRRAVRQAQIDDADKDVDPVVAAAMADEESIQQDPNAGLGEEIIADVAQASYRRGFRSGLRSAFRQADVGEPIAQDDVESTAQDPESAENAAVAGEVNAIAAQTGDSDVVAQAARAYRAGYRRGLRRAVRQLEQDTNAEEASAQDDESTAQDVVAPPGTIASYNNRNRRAVRQVTTPVAPADAIMQEVLMQDPNVVAAAASYRRAVRQAQIAEMSKQAPLPATMQDLPPAAPATMQVPPPAIMQDEIPATMQEALMQDPAVVAAAASYRRAIRNAQKQYTQEGEGSPYASDDELAQASIMSDGDDADAQMAAIMADLDEAQASAMMGDDSILPAGSVASYNPRARQQNRGQAYRQLDPGMPVQQDSYLADEISAAMMADELSSIQQDQISGDSPVRNYNPQAFRSAAPTGNAYDAQRQAEYWRRRAEELESVEAPGQRAFKSLGVKDQADRPGAYPAAFKSYLMKGLGLMTDTEKYILQGKGKARWQNASFSYDTATKSVKTYSSGSDASVGFLVPEDWVNELNKNVMTQTVMAPECKARTTTSDRIVQPNLNTTDARRAHPAQVRWPGESPASNTDHRTVEDEYTQVTIPIHVMLITLAATNSALEDATFNLEEEINEAFAEAVAVSYDQLIWGGDGQGKLQGIVTNSQVVGSPSLGMKTVGGYVATGSADGIVTADSLKTMLFHLPQGYRQRAKWYMNSNTGLQVATLKDGNGNYLIDQRDDALRTVGVPDRLLNKPIVYNEWADDADSGKFPIILADLTRGYIIGRRVEFSIRRFDDSNYAEHDQVLFLGRARLGGQVLQPASFKALKVALS
jgi:HK97 family phage major capsid protein